MGSTPVEALCQVIDRFKWAVTSLNYMPTAHQLEKWAMLVLEGMSGPSRLYHSPDHVLELAEGMDPVGTIAALFHDIVYYQVDGGLQPFIHSLIYPYFNVVNGILFIKDVEPPDFIYEVSLGVFGFNAGQQLLTNQGQNEFLSTLVALKVMSEVLSKWELVMVATCIEATIPFRATTDAMVRLEARLQQLNQGLAMGIGRERVSEGIERAVKLANRDVGNFAYDDAAAFLGQTWRLLPETNARLISSSMYTIKEYRIALFKMEGFLSFLQAESIFHRWGEEPQASEYRKLVEQARANLQVARTYLRIKLYAVAILEALSDITGGDAPLIYFMGDFQGQGRPLSHKRMEKYLGTSIALKDRKLAQDLDPFMLQLLEQGRSEAVSYDNSYSPLSAYLYRYLGEKQVLAKAEEAKQFFLGKTSSSQFLKAQDLMLVEDISQACATIAYTRKNRLCAIKKILGR